MEFWELVFQLFNEFNDFILTDKGLYVLVRAIEVIFTRREREQGIKDQLKEIEIQKSKEENTKASEEGSPSSEAETTSSDGNEVPPDLFTEVDFDLGCTFGLLILAFLYTKLIG